MGIKSKIEEIIQDELEGSEYFLVAAKSNESESDLKFYIDGDQGVGIAICSKLSRIVNATLEEQEIPQDKFKFEISSPGADKPLLLKRQYPQHIGRTLKVSLQDNTEKKGVLLEVNEEGILLNVELDKKKKVTEKVSLGFDQIKTATVQITFKKAKK